jgi:hypothetical protein
MKSLYLNYVSYGLYLSSLGAWTSQAHSITSLSVNDRVLSLFPIEPSVPLSARAKRVVAGFDDGQGSTPQLVRGKAQKLPERALC